jgi:hypothetical protein
MTFYYTNQQSARLMFYHDHAYGLTRLNVYAGGAAGYLITDDTEAKLMGPGGALEGLGLGIPLIVQDRTFVPKPSRCTTRTMPTGRSRATARTRPGTRPAGAATAACGITTCTCPRKTPAIRAA